VNERVSEWVSELLTDIHTSFLTATAQVRPTADQPWNVALDIDVTAPEKFLVYHQGSYGTRVAQSGWW
jgi:hypothetical protein